ncbi:unnamed protein product [Arabis nemorensis]|uniref:Uncharacterized protein n=1 Tax=Arabis nemorensis TaxID=586526 RepID=A0A565AXA9_9BRAS|nr:unnamed protein product [Arabis nemorensis]
MEGQGGCSGMKNKTSSETQSRDENQEIIQKSSLIPHILDIKNQEIPKRKRSQRKRNPKEPKKNSDSSQGERREGKESACDQIESDTEAEEDNDADKPTEEEEKSISEADLNQTVLGADTANEEIVSESEDSLPLLEVAETEEEEDVSESEDSLPCLEESETEEEEDVSDASSCNWWSFKTQPRTCERIRNVRWRNKKKRNCMTVEETQSNRKILLLAV